MAYLTEHYNVCLKEDSIPKTNARYTAENSLIGAMAQLIVVAMTYFYVADKEDVEWRQSLKEMNKDDLFFYRLLCHFHGGKPVRARPPLHDFVV